VLGSARALTTQQWALLILAIRLMLLMALQVLLVLKGAALGLPAPGPGGVITPLHLLFLSFMQLVGGALDLKAHTRPRLCTSSSSSHVGGRALPLVPQQLAHESPLYFILQRW
jgi:hypothetical protein